MTNGRGAGMASFMTKKKKYKFQVEICLEELLEVPFVSAVLFAKLRLLDGGNFQDHSSRQEVRDHKVQWNANFTFPCKMMANASTGVMERCVLRISIRKESKGGRSFNKLGFVDLNLAEYAGAGLIHKKALLEGYDARHRQDNSMLKFKIELNMISGDILFKAPSPSLKQSVNVDDVNNDQRSDEFSSGSLAGSIASGSSGFGSLPKKRPALLSSDLVIGQTLTENNVPVMVAADYNDLAYNNQTAPSGHVYPSTEDIIKSTEAPCEPGHSRNSSNTSQLSKASGYSSIHSHSHSRQSSSGDSGHIRDSHSRSLRMQKQFYKSGSNPKKPNIPNTIPSANNESFSLEKAVTSTPIKVSVDAKLHPNDDVSKYSTPKAYITQKSYISNSSNDDYRTPEGSLFDAKTDIFSQNFNELQKSSSTTVVEQIRNNMLKVNEVQNRKSDSTYDKPVVLTSRLSLEELEKNKRNTEGVLRSKSEFEIPKMPVIMSEKSFATKFFNSDNLFSFLTPRPARRNSKEQTQPNPTGSLKVPRSPSMKLKSLPETRTTSLSSLSSGLGNNGLKSQPIERNPSASSLVLSETGSLDRAKAAYERRKKNQLQESDAGTVPGRVEITRVNPDDLIDEIIKKTNLEQPDDSAETSGLQLFIAKDGTAAVGNHEVKSQMSTGVQVFKRVVMDNR